MSTTTIAIDIGFGNTKTVWNHTIDKGGRERWAEACFRSVTPAVSMDDQDSLGYHPDRIMIEVNGQKYYAGPAATFGVEARALDPNYIETDQHEVLMRAAIHIAMREMNRRFTSIDMLVLGLPVSGFAARGARLQEIGMRPRTIPVPRSLRGKDGLEFIEVKAKQVLVRPQPFGAMRYAAQNLHETDDLFKPGALSMVIDPGYRTLDWYVSNAMVPEMNLCGSFDGGVSSIFRVVSQRIGYDSGTGSLEFDQIEGGLESGQINLGYKVIDMQPYHAIAEQEADRQVQAFLARIDLNKLNIRRVFLAGGGARFYEKSLAARLPGFRIATVADSVMANARGYWLGGRDMDGEI